MAWLCSVASHWRLPVTVHAGAAVVPNLCERRFIWWREGHLSEHSYDSYARAGLWGFCEVTGTVSIAKGSAAAASRERLQVPFTLPPAI
jgi:hypothetical protein